MLMLIFERHAVYFRFRFLSFAAAAFAFHLFFDAASIQLSPPMLLRCCHYARRHYYYRHFQNSHEATLQH